MALGLSAAAWAGIGTVGSLGLGAYSASKAGGGSSQSGNETVTKTNTMDPRIGGMLFGNGTRTLKPGVTPTWTSGEPDAYGQTWQTASNPESDYTTDSGLLGQYQDMLGHQQNAGIQSYGNFNDSYLGNNAQNDLSTIRDSSIGQTFGVSPFAPATSAAQVNAPSQNNLDLSGAYSRFINGDAGANPYLTKATQGALDQSTNQFRQMQGDATDNLMRTVLPSIRSTSVLAGQYGGSRQGIAEGNAISDFTKQQGQAMTQFGQNNTNAAVGAQAQAFGQGQDRALAATQGLGAQQYGVAQQNAQNQQAANLANLTATTNNNVLNANVKQQGISNLGGLLSSAYATGQNQDAYSLNQAGKVNSLLSPYLGQVPGSSTTSQPLYSNTMGNMLGGASAGLALGKQIGGLLGNGTSSGAGNGSFGGGPAGTYYDGYSWVPIGQ